MTPSALCRHLNGYLCDIVPYYAARYSGTMPVDTGARFIAEVECEANATWYEMSLYEKHGHDYYGTHYTVGDSKTDDEWFERRMVNHFVATGKDMVQG